MLADVFGFCWKVVCFTGANKWPSDVLHLINSNSFLGNLNRIKTDFHRRVYRALPTRLFLRVTWWFPFAVIFVYFSVWIYFSFITSGIRTSTICFTSLFCSYQLFINLTLSPVLGELYTCCIFLFTFSVYSIHSTRCTHYFFPNSFWSSRTLFPYRLIYLFNKYLPRTYSLLDSTLGAGDTGTTEAHSVPKGAAKYSD